jgi:hypothetical protein
MSDLHRRQIEAREKLERDLRFFTEHQTSMGTQAETDAWKATLVERIAVHDDLLSAFPTPSPV